MEKWRTKLNRDTSLKKVPYGIRFFQKFKNFYSNKINSLPKKFSFWILISILFVFILPFCLGGVLAYIISKVKMEHLWIKTGLVALILIVTFQVGIGWTKDLLGMNTPPNLVINSPTTEEETKVKGVNTIEISGTVNPTGSTIKINNNIVIVTDDGNFTKEVFINKGENKINIIGKHGSGITEKTVLVYRELTKEELVEEKRLEEERKVKAEEKRIAREEARKKAEEEEAKNSELKSLGKWYGQREVFLGKKGLQYVAIFDPPLPKESFFIPPAYHSVKDPIYPYLVGLLHEVWGLLPSQLSDPQFASSLVFYENASGEKFSFLLFKDETTNEISGVSFWKE